MEVHCQAVFGQIRGRLGEDIVESGQAEHSLFEVKGFADFQHGSGILCMLGSTCQILSSWGCARRHQMARALATATNPGNTRTLLFISSSILVRECPHCGSISTVRVIMILYSGRPCGGALTICYLRKCKLSYSHFKRNRSVSSSCNRGCEILLPTIENVPSLGVVVE